MLVAMAASPNELRHYLMSRLEAFSASHRLTGFSLEVPSLHLEGATRELANKRTIPLVFGNQELGTFAIYPANALPETPEWAKDFAGQIAAILRHPRPSLAIQLDRKMEQMKKHHRLYDWCGIYQLEGDTLFLSAFRGAATPHAIIPKGNGICGAAVTENKTINIQDVASDPRYLSCDFRTKSEIVVPIRDKKGNAIAEIDIDSHTPNAFSSDDATRLEELARELARLMLE